MEVSDVIVKIIGFSIDPFDHPEKVYPEIGDASILI